MTTGTAFEVCQRSSLDATHLQTSGPSRRTPSRSIPTVFVVGGDLHLRQPLEAMIHAAGWRSEAFASGHDFLAHPRTAAPCCLVLDLNLPDLSGLELQERMTAERIEVPLVFLTDHSDVRVAVHAMKRGAIDFLTRPLDSNALLEAIRQALRRSEVVLSRDEEMQRLRANFASLSPREREVLTMVASGQPNKVVGGKLGISEITVKMHRGNAMRKMKAGSFAHLISMACKLRLVKTLATSTVSS